MATCSHCHATMADEARFCSHCGAAASADAHARSAGDPLRPARDFADRLRRRAATAVSTGTLGQRMAKGAAIGAVVALPVPFIGPIAGAIVGAGVGVYTKLVGD